jgi:hypothetical protein
MEKGNLKRYLKIRNATISNLSPQVRGSIIVFLTQALHCD